MNPPVSGVSLFISLIILAIGSFWQLLRRIFGIHRHFAPLLGTNARYRTGIIIVGLFIVMAILLTVSFFQVAIRHQHNNLALLTYSEPECATIPKQPLGDNLIILRLDDVQAYGWTDISIKMMNDALERDMPVVAGTIAKDITSDERITTFFAYNYCNVEVALHGYDHGIGDTITYERDGVAEFESLSRHAARRRISNAMYEFSQLPIGPVITFIPPQNLISDEARLVLREYGLNYLSSEGSGIFDYHAATWDFKTNTYVYSKTVLSDCEQHFADGNRLCVIMLHPQDYALADASLDTARYRDYEWLLDDIRQNNYQVVTFQDLGQDQFYRLAAHDHLVLQQ